MFVIGTAGHIDHGKSSLILNLTGIDPDRLPEEKERAMTIDLGFSWYDTPSGQRLGIVDVPGHERFVRNMIAGAGGIDAVILVVAADDGWMPQTQEHLRITELLGVKYGIIALTKIDLVDDDWIKLVADDLRIRLKGTYLETAPIVKLSSITGQGFDELKNQINTLSDKIVERTDIGKPRLYIDRSFLMAGMGGVATGTLRGGSLAVGDDIAVFPHKKNGRIRSMQSHNQAVEKAYPGQRTALALTGVDHQYINRGGVVGYRKMVEAYPDGVVLALNLSVLQESPAVITDRRRLLMILGTTEVEGEIRTMSERGIAPGQSGIAFFNPFGPVMAFVGDRYIVRMPTPQNTVGGGMVLDLISRFPRRKDMSGLAYLEKRREYSLTSLIQSELDKKVFVDTMDFRFSSFSDEQTASYLEDRRGAGELQMANGRFYRAADVMAGENMIMKAISSIFDHQPHLDGLKPEMISEKTGQPAEALTPIIELLLSKKALIKKGNRLDLPERGIAIKGELKKLADDMEKALRAGEYTPPTISELTDGRADKQEVLNFLIVAGKAVKINTDLVFHFEIWTNVVASIRNILDSGNSLSVSTLRDYLGCSRKYLIPILEYTDKTGLTRRDGDVRVRGDNYERE